MTKEYGAERAPLGFDDTLENTDADAWVPNERTVSNDRPGIPTEELRKVGEEAGFVSREAKTIVVERQPIKRQTEQINIRADVEAIAMLRQICISQEPAWQINYGFERAVAALRREMERR